MPTLSWASRLLPVVVGGAVVAAGAAVGAVLTQRGHHLLEEGALQGTGVPDPAAPASVGTAVAALRQRHRVVVWLDDVERYLGTDGR